MLYDRSAGARHPAGISAGSRIPDRGDDVFYSGRGDVYDTYRRKCGNKYDADEKTVADGVSDIYPRFYRDHIGAGSSGAGRAGARGAEYGSCAVCGVRRGNLPCGVTAPHAVQYFAGAYADRALYYRFCTGIFSSG